MDPQLAPTDAQLIGVHAGTHAPFTHAVLPEHVPQSGVRPPQPFATWPQTAPSWLHVSGTHGSEPH
jgi:hypothetical protein